MAAPPCSSLQNSLQAAVQSVQWTYSLFWQMCPQQGVLIWGDGYYNGAIKTRKTVQPVEVSAEEASLQRSQQLRELYESLSAGDTNQPTRRPCAALSPEDLTESEWFYLMCVSFSFAPGVGLPGKAYTRGQHVWLTGATESDSKMFSRAILAKSARVQTVVCIPILDGVVEFGTTERVEEDAAFIQHVKSFFTNEPIRLGSNPPPLPLPPPPPPPQKPALSEHSTSNPTSSSGHTRFLSLSVARDYSAADPMPVDGGDEEEDEDEDDEDDDDDDSEDETGRLSPTSRPSIPPRSVVAAAAEPSEVMQLDMSEDIRLGSPEDGSNMESDFMDAAGRITSDCQRRANGSRAESSQRWDIIPQLPPPMEADCLAADNLPQEDTHYSQTVSVVLQKQCVRWTAEQPSSSSSSAVANISGPTNHSAFSNWLSRSDHHSHLHNHSEGTSQWLLKYILFSVPYLHNKYLEENSPKSRDGDSSSSRLRKSTTAAQDELSANHVLAERRRREKLNERFIILRSLVPFVTKMDKASILGDTIEYVKQLRKKIQDLESRNHQMEEQQNQVQKLSKELISCPPDRKRLRIIEGAAKLKSTETVPPPPPPPTLPPPPVPQPEVGTSVEVSIIESDALIELQCGYREGLLLDIMQTLRDVRLETTGVLSSNSSNTFVAEIRAKVKDTKNGRKLTIMEVKRAINQIIPRE